MLPAVPIHDRSGPPRLPNNSLHPVTGPAPHVPPIRPPPYFTIQLLPF